MFVYSFLTCWMEHHNWDDALFLDEETAALLFAEAQKIVDVPDAPPEITEHQDAHALFLHFNDLYFGGALAGVEVKWSSRMTLFVNLYLIAEIRHQ